MVSGKSVSFTTENDEDNIPIERVYLPSKLTKLDGFAYDICLVRLTRKPNILGLKPAKLSSVGDLLGKRAIYSGYGELGLGSTGKDAQRFQRPHPGMRFGFENILDKYILRDAVVNSTFDEIGLPLEGATSIGDSGTGMFIEADGKWELAAVNAHSSASGLQHSTGANKSVYGSTSGSVRIAPFLPEINLAVLKNDPKPFMELTPEVIEARTKEITPRRGLGFSSASKIAP